MIEVNVIYTPDWDEPSTYQIRGLFCTESAKNNKEDRNPLMETKFNELLNQIAQKAFDEGREYERKNKLK